MSDMAEGFISGGFVFYNNFDSANLAKVIQVDINAINDNGENEDTKSGKNGVPEENLDYEFNLWTKHDCHGTEFENSNRTWFYFGVKAPKSGALVRLNVINLNKQVKMFSQGMCPVYKILPGHPHWERIRDRPIYALDEKSNEFTLSFTYRTPENPKAITYFAFTYPFTYSDLQTQLKKIQTRLSRRTITSVDDIYYHRECVIKSLEGRRLELLTISSFQNISMEREDRLMNLFPEKDEERPFKFRNKKVVFVSARVHPGETPSSFVLNGLLNLLLNREDPVAITLRRLYVFKLIPMLNPDGVAKGHYRMDTKGVNLNRVYLNPSEKEHPTIFAARTLIRYYHNVYKLPEETEKIEKSNVSFEVNHESNIIIPESVTNVVRDTTNHLLEQVTLMSLDEKSKSDLTYDKCHKAKENILRDKSKDHTEERRRPETADNKRTYKLIGSGKSLKDPEDSGLFVYIDLHGHASKKGIFMYGNYFDDSEESISCLLLPKLMSLNNPNFHFTSCNFAERNMYLIDKRDGMSREGSGRVAVYKLTGLIRSYTLECNYNSGRLVNALPPRVRDTINKIPTPIYVPPKYTPAVYEEVGAALGPSILDLTSSNPNSRLSNSQFHSLRGLKSYLKLTYANNCSAPMHKPLHKENSGVSGSNVSTQENISEEKTETPASAPPIDNATTSTKIEVNIVRKPCMVRRTTSLYSAIKKIKNNKKPKQIINRKSVKAQNSSNQKPTIQNTSLISKIQTKNQTRAKKKFLKTADYRQTMETNCLEDKCTLVQAKKRRPIIKSTIHNNHQKQCVNMEITTIVKQGSKRLKVIGAKIMKTRPEIGESADENSLDRKIIKATSSRTISMSNKQKSKGSFVKTKKQFLKVEQTKSKKSSKMKMKNRKKNDVNDSTINQISSDTTN